MSLLPIDSEHSAIFQALAGHRKEEIKSIILTASGGPFLKTPLGGAEARSRPEQALKHPQWRMGKKVTIDSASLMNKGLEVIEAHWLFGVPPSPIEVHIHPQSIVHSMVEYIDGSIIAQMALPDMRGPIAYALSYPERLDLQLPSLNLFEAGPLSFSPVDEKRFPALGLAYRALEEGGTMPAVLNAANEVAVEAFLQGRLGFRQDSPSDPAKSWNATGPGSRIAWMTSCAPTPGPRRKPSRSFTEVNCDHNHYCHHHCSGSFDLCP